AIGLLLAGTASFVIPRNIANQLAVLEENTLLISSGNLTQEVAGKGTDEIGRVAHAFEKMRIQLHNLVASISNVSTQILNTNRDLTENSEQTNESSIQIANSIDEIASGVEQQSIDTSTILDSLQ